MSASFYKNMRVRDPARKRQGTVLGAMQTEDSWNVHVQWDMAGKEWVGGTELDKVEQKKVKS